tara:strand:- start:265 stop:525 length:261 start_codon:yes stop_codon:yes gene_type:complete
MEGAGEALGEEFDDLKFDELQEGGISGMDVASMNAKATIKGTTINIDVGIFASKGVAQQHPAVDHERAVSECLTVLVRSELWRSTR